MRRGGQLVFLCAFLAALALYALTVPNGLPWNVSSHLALAYLGEVVRFPVMPHPVWGFHVRVFYGSVALSVCLAAMAAGLLAVLVNRYFGWRFAAAAALVWTFLPDVWNRVITGDRAVCLVAMAFLAAWALNAIILRVLRKAREVWASRSAAPAAAGGDGPEAIPSHGEKVRRKNVSRWAGWTAMGAASVFALASLTLHDYRYGEAASAFARGVVEAAGERIIVLSGVVDDQIIMELKRSGDQRNRSSNPDGRRNENTDVLCRPKPSTTTLRAVSLRIDDAYRTNLVAKVRSAFPGETNLWAAAQVSAAAFVDVATKKFPDRFYLMKGQSTTLEQWTRRWEDFKPYLASRDPFVSVARRMFGYEGNCIANAMLESKAKVEGADRRSATCAPSTSARDLGSTAAWRLYKRVYEEIDPGNFSALVNMGEMIRRGHAVSGDEQKRVKEALETFLKDANRRQHVREIARAAGPVRVDAVRLEKMAAETRMRIAAKVAAGEKLEHSPEALSLLEWSHEMFALMDKGETAKAGRIARAILSNPKWRGYTPANAVMGAVSAVEGDYVASEAFFRAATATTNRVSVVVLNDYADTLMHLGKLDEAERMARQAVTASDERFWVARLTLAQVLEKRGRKDEARELLSSVLKRAPEDVRARVRQMQKDMCK